MCRNAPPSHLQNGVEHFGVYERPVSTEQMPSVLLLGCWCQLVQGGGGNIGSTMARLLVGSSGAGATWTGQFRRGSARVRTDDIGRSGPLVDSFQTVWRRFVTFFSSSGVLIRGLVPNGGELFVEVVVLAPDDDGGSVCISHSAI
ncbi:hypothetical protein TIFTF001_008011 [Ficus carica]|uniref:Uncharacterized protein n=1 Tax=Ficus carica TaxID=3494 RepID=A0AA87ZSA3_FICCA|nr:hypothetical protein TIFTF001_008011 [Ficus carica]